MTKVSQLQDSFNNNIGQLVDDINRQNNVLKGCIDSLKAWTGAELSKLQRAQVFNFLSTYVLEANNGMETSFTIYFLGKLADHYSQLMQDCKRVTNILRIIGSNQEKVKEAVSLLGLVDEYVNMCNRFAVAYQMTHNIAEETNHPMRVSRDHGFDLAGQVFQHFARYFSTLELRIHQPTPEELRSTSAVGWVGFTAKLLVRKYKYKALSIQRQWSWVNLHHIYGKKYPARQSPR